VANSDFEWGPKLTKYPSSPRLSLAYGSLSLSLSISSPRTYRVPNNTSERPTARGTEWVPSTYPAIAQSFSGIYCLALSRTREAMLARWSLRCRTRCHVKRVLSCKAFTVGTGNGKERATYLPSTPSKSRENGLYLSSWCWGERATMNNMYVKPAAL
jgi:hypothetical protein